MGAYRYVKTTTLAEVVWEDREGRQHQNVVPVAIYAYKPWSSWGSEASKANREMEFRWVTPWRSAWRRKAGDVVPRLSVIGERDETTKAITLRTAEGQAVWSTGGVAFVDDHNTPVGKVVRVVVFPQVG